jgi:hypothetical protein
MGMEKRGDVIEKTLQTLYFFYPKNEFTLRFREALLLSSTCEKSTPILYKYV